MGKSEADGKRAFAAIGRMSQRPAKVDKTVTFESGESRVWTSLADVCISATCRAGIIDGDGGTVHMAGDVCAGHLYWNSWRFACSLAGIQNAAENTDGTIRTTNADRIPDGRRDDSGRWRLVTDSRYHDRCLWFLAVVSALPATLSEAVGALGQGSLQDSDSRF